MYTYLLIDLLSVSIPALFTFHPRLRFHDTWFAFWPASLLTAAIFIAWDVLFTGWGIWGFNPDYLLGISWFGLPLEEWLFFICIPYACVFTYASLKTLVRKDFLQSVAQPGAVVLILGLAIAALFFREKTYTAVTAASTALFIAVHLILFGSRILGRFFLSYAVIFLFPFLIVNGILTGSFLESPVVWYDNTENLGIRIFTIPVEDFIYGLLLFLMNVTFYEWFLIRRKTDKASE